MRCIKNPLVLELLALEKKGATFEEMEAITVGSLRKAVKEGNVKEGSFMAGQIAGMVNKIEPAASIIEEMFAQYREIMQKGGSVG